MTKSRRSVTSFAFHRSGTNCSSSMTQPISGVTGYDYTVLGQQKNVTSPGYDANSNRTSIVDRNGRQRTFTYDNMDRLTSKKWLDG